jgi:hypothetical protein
MIEDQHGLYHAIPLQSGGIALRVKVEDSGRHSLVPFLNIFGRLYYGTVNRQYFKQLFQTKKQQFIEQLRAPTADTEKFSDFRLRMTRLALTDPWRWPACINLVAQEPEWATGNGRTLATGFCRPNPEQHLAVLFFDQTGADVTQWIDNPTEITSDEQLHQLLGLVRDVTQSPSIQLYSLVRQVNDRTCLFLHGFIDEDLKGYQNSQEAVELTTLKKLQAWQQQYPQPTLEIYTDWPELITDSAGVWNYRIAGDIKHLCHHIFYPGHLERLAKNEHGSQATRNHVLYVKNPRAIDLSEFLIWVDLEHTTFIDQTWDFLLYQRLDNYKSRMISFSST